MHVRRLIIRNFRIYAFADITFPHGIIAIVGDNAQGKTTLIEAIVFALTGESPRTHEDRELIKKGTSYTNVKILVKLEGGGDHWLEAAIADGRKRWIVDGKARRKGEEGWAPFHIVCFLPHEVQIAIGEPRGRRELLDKMLCHWSHSYHFNLLNYRRAMAHRNALLEEISESKSLTNDAKTKIDNWNLQLVKYGIRLIETRLEFIQRWQPFVQDFFLKLGERGKVRLNYASSLGDDICELYSKGKAEALLERYVELLEKALPNDIEVTATTIGPHRDDFQVLIDEMNVRDFGSFGQQKMAVLAMKLSLGKLHEQERKMSSIVLLDDALSQLDNKRRHNLLEILQGYEQCIMTMTTPEDIPKHFWEYCAFFRTEGGEVKRIK